MYIFIGIIAILLGSYIDKTLSEHDDVKIEVVVSSKYDIKQVFDTNVAKLTTDAGFISSWDKEKYFGAIRTQVIDKKTGDVIDSRVCIVRFSEWLKNTKKSEYQAAKDIIEAREEFDNIEVE